MNGRICEMLEIEFPIFAFSHCRDVVAAVTNAGGFGVLGASSYTPEQLENELSWLDQAVMGKSYGVDILVPEIATSAGVGEQSRGVPPEYLEFVTSLLAKHDVSLSSANEALPTARNEGHSGWPASAGPGVGAELCEVAFKHPIRLVASALGVPPPFMIDGARSAGVALAAMVGAKEHAIKQLEAGVDLLIAQGMEAGGHCGEVTTMVLVPEVLKAIKPINDVPVLAAGGIVTGRQMAAAMALGASGVWTGSVWLTTSEAETSPHIKDKLLGASSRDTIRSKCRTGKPSRLLRSAWTDAWEETDAPPTLPMPLQAQISEPVFERIDNLAQSGHEGAKELATYWVGQGVGLMDQAQSVRNVVLQMVEEFLEGAESLAFASRLSVGP